MQSLERTRRLVRQGAPDVMPAWGRLLADAGKFVDSEIKTVLDKVKAAPSGDMQDYLSQGVYWWPNPDTEDGRPYVRRDGEVNPEVHRLDRTALQAAAHKSRTLSLAWWFGGNDAFARSAAQFLQAWFLDPSTRMNPNFHYAATVPGRQEDGRGLGLIEATCLPPMLEGAQLLEYSDAWTQTQSEGLRQWFDEFLDWINSSPHGRKGIEHPNNIGSWTAAQRAYYALYVGRPEVARAVLSNVPEHNIARQIEPDGSQPLELERTRSFGYSCSNLHALLDGALLGRHVNVDLWGFETADGRSIAAGLRYLVRHGLAGPWPHEQITKPPIKRLLSLLRKAALLSGDPSWEETLHCHADADWALDPTHLLHPPRTD
jgi:hypothetical protein